MTIDLGIPGITQGVPAGSSRRWQRFLARAVSDGRGVAVLVLDQPTRSDIELMRTHAKRLIRASRDRHALTIHRAGMTPDGRLYLIMAHPGGRSLRTHLAETRAPDAGQVMTWERGIRGALAVAHRDGLVHGNVGPDSIVITNRGRALLADLAVAELDRHAGIAGRSPYASPVQDAQDAVDLFAAVLNADLAPLDHALPPGAEAEIMAPTTGTEPVLPAVLPASEVSIAPAPTTPVPEPVVEPASAAALADTDLDDDTLVEANADTDTDTEAAEDDTDQILVGEAADDDTEAADDDTDQILVGEEPEADTDSADEADEGLVPAATGVDVDFDIDAEQPTESLPAVAAAAHLAEASDDDVVVEWVVAEPPPPHQPRHAPRTPSNEPAEPAEAVPLLLAQDDTKRGVALAMVAATIAIVGIGFGIWWALADDGGVSSTSVEAADTQLDATPSPSAVPPTPTPSPTVTGPELVGPPSEFNLGGGEDGDGEDGEDEQGDDGDDGSEVKPPPNEPVAAPSATPEPAIIAPSISGVLVGDVGVSQATLTFNTSTCTTVRVDYSADAGQDSGTVAGGTACSSQHTIFLNNPALRPGTAYTATIVATDVEGRTGTTSVPFLTLQPPPTPTPPPPPTASPIPQPTPNLPPPSISAVRLGPVNDSTTLSFTTNICTNARFDWVSLDGAVGGSLLSDAWPDANGHCWKQHSALIGPGLEQGRTYTLTIQVVDKFGRSTSVNQQFSVN